jgi:hypothetical protein
MRWLWNWVPGELRLSGPLESTFSGARNALDDERWLRDEKVWREIVTCAWLAPLLLGGPNPAAAPRARGMTPMENLSRWMSRVGRPAVRGRWAPPEEEGGHAPAEPATPLDTEMSAPPHRGPGSAPDEWTAGPRVVHSGRWQVPVPLLPISVEVALAQGFKHAANRRACHSRAETGWRTHLAEQTLELLKRSGFWYSQLTLLQALGLLSLPDSPADENRRMPGPSRPGVYRPDIRARVHHWVEAAGSLRDDGRESRHEGSPPAASVRPRDGRTGG